MTRRRKTKRGREKKKRKKGGGGCTSYLRVECTRGHILHSIAVAFPMFNSLSLFFSVQNRQYYSTQLWCNRSHTDMCNSRENRVS